MRSPHANSLPARAQAAATFPGLLVVAVVAAAAWLASLFVDALSPLVAGIVLGAVVANTTGVPDAVAPGARVAARSLLRLGIVLLGLRLSLGDLAGLGPDGLVVVAAVVTVTFVGTRWIARRLGVSDDLGLLVATGYSICGASAIAAMDGVVRAEEEEVAYAISLVTLCGTLSIVALPLLGSLAGVEGATFGTWVGGAVHDVGQVVVTAAHAGDESLEAATVVKLSRVVLLAPLVALVALRARRRSPVVVGERRPPIVPLFVVGFLAAILLRSADVLSTGSLDTAATIEKVLLTAALVALGMGVDVRRLRKLGGRPLALGMIAWVLVAGSAAVGTPLVA
ncbi:MAG: YeiH family protein [Acidimicrobiia bacterium]